MWVTNNSIGPLRIKICYEEIPVFFCNEEFLPPQLKWMSKWNDCLKIIPNFWRLPLNIQYLCSLVIPCKKSWTEMHFGCSIKLNIKACHLLIKHQYATFPLQYVDQFIKIYTEKRIRRFHQDICNRWKLI